MPDFNKIPEHMQETARRYIERGYRGGDFFNALVSNDLMGAVGKADDENRDAIWKWCSFLYNEAPSSCFGSPEIVAAWIDRGGIMGREAVA